MDVVIGIVICGKEDIVTKPRDFSHLKDGW